jgi:uncharacterized membrane protein
LICSISRFSGSIPEDCFGIAATDQQNRLAAFKQAPAQGLFGLLASARHEIVHSNNRVVLIVTAAERRNELFSFVGTAVDTAGVSVMVIGAIIATARFLLKGQADALSAYRVCRQDLGRAILLGLESLVAGDIIRTVVVHPTLDNLLVLAVIVLIRTFLSTTLQLEVEGHWRWQQSHSSEMKVQRIKDEQGRGTM